MRRRRKGSRNNGRKKKKKTKSGKRITRAIRRSKDEFWGAALTS